MNKVTTCGCSDDDDWKLNGEYNNYVGGTRCKRTEFLTLFITFTDLPPHHYCVPPPAPGHRLIKTNTVGDCREDECDYCPGFHFHRWLRILYSSTSTQLVISRLIEQWHEIVNCNLLSKGSQIFLLAGRVKIDKWSLDWIVLQCCPKNQLFWCIPVIIMGNSNYAVETIGTDKV